MKVRNNFILTAMIFASVSAFAGQAKQKDNNVEAISQALLSDCIVWGLKVSLATTALTSSAKPVVQAENLKHFERQLAQEKGIDMANPNAVKALKVVSSVYISRAELLLAADEIRFPSNDEEWELQGLKVLMSESMSCFKQMPKLNRNPLPSEICAIGVFKLKGIRTMKDMVGPLERCGY